MLIFSILYTGFRNGRFVFTRMTTEEDLFFNFARLKNEQRKELYLLRKKLTEQYIEKKSVERIRGHI